MKSSIVPITFALLQPQLITSKGIKGGVRKNRGEQVQLDAVESQTKAKPERELYTYETIGMEEEECCISTVAPVTEVDYIDFDEETAGMNNTPSPTEAVPPRPTPFHTEEPTEDPTSKLYTYETIEMEEAECCISTVVPVTEVNYINDDDETAGTNKTLSPTEAAPPRPTPFPTEEPTVTPLPTENDVTPPPSPNPTEIIITASPTETAVTQAPSPNPTEAITPWPTESTPAPSPEPTPNPTPNPTPFPASDDGGLTDDEYISMPDPTPYPIRKPSRKPIPSYGNLPTSSYSPTIDDKVDTWAPGWMPTYPLMNDDDKNPIDMDDWNGGFPVDRPTWDTKAGKSSGKSSKSSGKSEKGGKSGKGSKSGTDDNYYVTDDAYKGYGVNGLSKISSLISSESVNSAKAVDNFAVTAVTVISGLFVYLYV